MFFIAYAFKGQVHVFAGRVKIVCHSPFRTSAILKYFSPLSLVARKRVLGNCDQVRHNSTSLPKETVLDTEILHVVSHYYTVKTE